MKKLLRYKNVLYYHLTFFNGNMFYAIEYFKYFLDNNLDVQLIIRTTPKFQKEIIKNWKEKYNSNINKLLPKVIFITNQKIITDNIVILDLTSYKDKDKIFFSKKIIYNYGDDAFQALKKPLKDKKVITIGDKRLGYKLDLHLPLKLNFTLFKEIKKFQDNTFIENKILGIHVPENTERNIKNFHETFNKVKIYQKEFYERANRLIPECKFYNKDIELIKIQEAILRKDAFDLRLYDPLDFYDININLNQEISWKDLLISKDIK